MSWKVFKEIDRSYYVVVVVSLASIRPGFPYMERRQGYVSPTPTYIQGNQSRTHQPAVLGGSVSSPLFPH